MSKHAPGPWTRKAKSRTVHAGGIRITQSGYRGAASVQAEQAFNEMLEANAQLVSAAPELLEACREAMEACRDNLQKYQYKNEPLLCAAFDKCKAAIEKATAGA